MAELRDYQIATLTDIKDAVREGKRRLMVQMPTGCHAPGSLVLTFDGGEKRVEDVEVGDRLMGPDSAPRHVLALHHGNDDMFSLVPKRAASPFIVNAGHILSLVQTQLPGRDKRSVYNGERRYCSVLDYLTETQEFRHIHKLELSGRIEFPRSGIAGNVGIKPADFFDPYLLGVLLGDGSIIAGSPTICCCDDEIVQAVVAIAAKYRVQVTKYANNRGSAPQYSLRVQRGENNPITLALRYLRLWGTRSGTKFIPFPYKVAPMEDRLQLLAGLIDTDGHFHNGGFDYVTKSKQLALDVAFVARSSGLAVSESTKIINSGPYVGNVYWRLHINGETGLIPTRVVRKKAGARMQIKNPLITGFDVESAGPGEYFGFEVDEDNLYLTADFMIHHNSGKTRLAAEIVNGARGKKKRVIFEVPAISLVDQTVGMFHSEGISDVGVIQASHHMTDWSKPIQICSVQTLTRKGEVPEADVVIRDEAHKIFKFDIEWMLLDRWRNTPFIGLSATPWTKGLGRVYEELIVGSTTHELIEKQWLVPMRVFAPMAPDLKPDLSEVRTTAGDYNEKDLHKAVMRDKLIADIVKTWSDKAEGRPTICFAVDRNHADTLRQRFNAAGVPAAYMDCETPLWERRDIQRSFERGDIKVVCNVEIVGIGVDWPSISCISYCRPTKSEMRFVQNIGRGLRPSPGKADLLILDHSDTHMRLGFVVDIHHEGLNGGRLATEPVKFVKLPKQCPACGYLKSYGVRVCPNCAHETVAPPPIVENLGGRLEEFKGRKKRKGDNWGIEEKMCFYAELKGYGISKGYKPGWAAMKYRDRLKVWPRGSVEDVPATSQMSAATMQWIRSQNIAWAKSKQKQGAVEQVKALAEYRATVPGTLCTEQDLEDFK